MERRTSPPPHEPFTSSEALAHGITRRQLQTGPYEQLHRGVWLPLGVEHTLQVWIAADRKRLPFDAALSHTTALQWYGVELGPDVPRHYSTNTTSQSFLADVVLHRRKGTLHPGLVRGVPVLGPDRTLVDCAVVLERHDLIRAGDALVRLGLTDPARLISYAEERHLDGVASARRSARWVRERVDSFKETDLRLLLSAVGLPAPEVNPDIFDADGRFLARGDLVYRRFRLVVEYDGWYHERSSTQRQKDLRRRERLERAGWTVLVLTASDLRSPMETAGRIWHALRANGYRGPEPVHDKAALAFLRKL